MNEPIRYTSCIFNDFNVFKCEKGFPPMAETFPNVAGRFPPMVETFPHVAGHFPPMVETFPHVAGHF
jgi:hypothetical protein